MPWLPSGLFLALLLTGPCLAAPPAAPAKATAPAAPVSASSAVAAHGSASPAALPDYGGRDTPGLLAGVGTDAPNPLAQAGRSLLALMVVLGGIIGVVTVLKRSGYTGSGPLGLAFLSGLRALRSAAAPVTEAATPAVADQVTAAAASGSGPLTLLQSQALPGGGAVHLLSVDGSTRVLVGATAQGVSLLAEWEWEEEEAAPEPTVPAAAAPLTGDSFSQHLIRAGAPPPHHPLSDLLADTRVRPIGTKRA